VPCDASGRQQDYFEKVKDKKHIKAKLRYFFVFLGFF